MTGFQVEEEEIASVRTYRVTPPDARDDRLLVHTHGGAYVFNGGPSGVVEAVFIANATGTQVCVCVWMWLIEV